MKITLILALIVILGVSGCSRGTSTGTSLNGTAPPDRDATKVLLHGQEIASAVSIVTSTAISPLLGVCLLGSYEYFHADPAERVKLPMYSSPWFWIPIGILLGLILVKDTFGGFAPMIKKPLDAIEVLMLNKASLIFIGFPVVFHQVAKLAGLDSIAQVFALLLGGVETVAFASGGSDGFVHSATQISITLIMLVLGMVAMFAVWLVGHAMDVLILLSPFPFLDLLLKGMRTALFAVLVGSSVINRSLGLVLALVVIVTSLLLMGWAFRLAIFGMILASDMLLTMAFGWRSDPKPGAGVSGFTARRMKLLAKRTYGKLVRSADGRLEFHCRRMLVGDLRKYPLDETQEYMVGRGLFQPSLIRASGDNDEHEILIRLLPRYLGSEESIRELLGIRSVKDIRVPRGLKAFWNWLSDTAGETEPQPGS